MNEIRIDPLTGLRSIVAPARAERPNSGYEVEPPQTIDLATDPFAEGHEDRTPPEVYALRPGDGKANSPGWKTRVVPNLYPALSEESADLEQHHDTDLLERSAAHGAHEVIINAPESVTSLADLSVEQVCLALETWQERIKAHDDAAYTHLIVNERREAGASLPHTHAQLYALDFVPASIARERERFGAHATRTMGRNLLEDLIQEEVRLNERVVSIDDDVILLSPYAARSPYQLMIAPRKPRKRFEGAGPTGAEMLHQALNLFREKFGAVPPLNMWLRTAPQGADHFCWRIEIVPRLTVLAGLELGTGVNLNIVSPERAADELRDLL